MHRGQIAINKRGDIFLSGAYEGELTINDTISVTGDPNNLHVLLIKFDSAGNFRWIKTSSGSGGAGAKAISVDDDNTIYISGDMQGEVNFDGFTLNEPGGGIFTLKIKDLDVDPVKVKTLNTDSRNEIVVYPNPSGSAITIQSNSEIKNAELKIENALGQLIYSKKIAAVGILNETVDLSKHPKSIYFIEIGSEKGREVRKAILE